LNYHIAQVNVALGKEAMDSPSMQGFVNRLDEINALADHSPGFVWRLQTDDGDATAIRVFDDPNLLINMSVWESVEGLRHFVYKTAHMELIRDRELWFEKLSQAHQALWWIPINTLPTAEQGRDKLLQLRSEGPSESVFTLAKPFPPPT